MNRTETTVAIVWLDLLAAKAKDEAAKLRADLEADARAEYDSGNGVPSWRVPDICTVSGSVSKQSVVVENEAAFLAWVKTRYPDAIRTVESVSSHWRDAFLDRAEVDAETVSDPATGEVVPGVKVRPAGRFLGISVRTSTGAKQVLGAAAHEGLKHAALVAGPTGTKVLAELEPAKG